MAQPIKGPCKIVRRQNSPKPPYQTPKISHSQIKNKQSASDRIADTNPFDAMENRDKVKLALKLTIATCITVAVSIFVASKLHNHRKRNRRKTSPSPCYLKAESKPQYTFKRVLADNSYSSFKHLKLNATNTSTSEECVNLHPYKAEISALLKEPNVEVLELFNENLEELTSRDSYVWVETESQLQELAEVLSGERAFAVDTEQHSLRSFLGFTCLIQISTKREDYLVDTIALHDMMGILRPIFANPEICKVFHGADNDVLWLQRDFHIYVVNLFDTAKEPPAIMLLFEPKGRPEDEDNDFYIQSKKNICVSCGEGNHYLRYRIIPSCYRMHFPEHLKSHRSHDIVLLCVDCHEIAHAAAEKYKKEVAAEFGIPLFVRKVFDSSQMQNTSASNANIEEDGVPPLQLRTAAMALLRHGSRMPSRRREELEEIVRNYYGGREITEGDLEKALLIGMSPHERRRFEKKKKLASKQPTTDVGSDDNQEPSSDAKAEFAPTDELLNRTESCCNKEDTNTVVLTEMDIDNQSLPSNAEVNCEVPVANGKDLTNKSEFSVSDHISDPDSIIAENGNISSESGLVQSNNDVNLKQHPKLSLLGHGPHGKQVVEFILKEHGEEGVSEFCQRWRQVFVEALQPRFLPGGWNVMHRLESSRIFLIVIQHSHNCFQYDRTL
nr:protein RRP6-like 3 isoform X2 [Ipomoea batatas]